MFGKEPLEVARAPKDEKLEVVAVPKPEGLAAAAVENDEGLDAAAVANAEAPELAAGANRKGFGVLEVGVATSDADDFGLAEPPGAEETDRGFECATQDNLQTVRRPERTLCQIDSVRSQYGKVSENNTKPSELTNSKCTRDRSG
jgi:hypothetical protein